MKVNKAPEKIYLFENPITKEYDDRWLSKRSDKNDIEYVRTDAFIEKTRELPNDETKIGETQIYIEDDGGEPPYGGKQWLDLGCLEYEIPKDKFRDGDDVEIIIRKIRK